METATRLTLWIDVLAGTSVIAIWITCYMRRFNAPRPQLAPRSRPSPAGQP